jgi:serine protease AprX
VHLRMTARLVASLLVLLAGVAPTFAITVPTARAALPLRLDATLPLHPALQLGALAEPARSVRVIVQTRGPVDVPALLVQLPGATLVETFPFIDGLLLALPQQLTPTLAVLPGVRAVTPDAPVALTRLPTAALATTYPGAIGAPGVWNDPARPATGAGVTVAVVDSGVDADHPDLAGRVVAVDVSGGDGRDPHGHGTHVAGTLAGRGPGGRYLGIAPDARVISVRIADADGASSEAALLRGLQWVDAHAGAERIRVVNLSLSVQLPTPAVLSPVAAAVERLWRGGVVVVASSGNRGDARDAAWFPPGNDPFVIAVGALDHAETVGPADDRLATFSSHGRTQEGHVKPDVVAPGRRIVAPLAGGATVLARQFPDRIIDGRYLRLSGTSMAAPVVAGAAALLLERSPTLTPDQVKWLLTGTGRAYAGQADAAGVVDPRAAIEAAAGRPVGSANAGLPPSVGLPLAVAAGEWGQSYWDAAYWTQSYWDDGGPQD